MINVILLRANSLYPEAVQIDSGCEAMQKLVGGLFDIVRPAGYMPERMRGHVLTRYDIYVNDEGLLIGMAPNICLNPEELEAGRLDYAGILVGDIVIAGHDEEGRTTGVNPDDMKLLLVSLHSFMFANRARRRLIDDDLFGAWMNDGITF